MDGFAEHGLDDDAFGQSKGGLASFDAFREFLYCDKMQLPILWFNAAIRHTANSPTQPKPKKPT